MGDLLSENIELANKILNEIPLEEIITDEAELLKYSYFNKSSQ